MCNLQPVSGQDRDGVADLDSQLQAQERIINISYALASEASQRSKQVAGEALGTASEAGPHPLLLGLRAWHGLSGSVEKQASGSLDEGQWYVPLSRRTAGLARGTGAQECPGRGCIAHSYIFGVVLLFRFL